MGIPGWEDGYIVHCGQLYDPQSRGTKRNLWFGVKQGLIFDRGPGAEFPRHLPILDLSRYLVTPGLIEAHCHLMLLADGIAPELYIPQATQAQLMANVVNNLLIASHVGLTAVCDLGSVNTYLLDLRRHLENQEVWSGRYSEPRNQIELASVGIDTLQREEYVQSLSGPLTRILSVGAPLTPTGGHGWYFGGTADTATDLLQKSRLYRAAGAECIKIMGNGGGSLKSRPSAVYYEVSDLRELVAEAREYSQPVTIHANYVETIQRALNAGLSGIEHATFLKAPLAVDANPKILEGIAEAGMWITPTFLPLYKTIEVAKKQRKPLSPVQQRWLDLQQVYQDDIFRLVRLMHQMGVRLLAGTDSGWRLVRFDDYPKELQLLQLMGLSDEEIIYNATLGVAQARGVADAMGSLKIGSMADFTVFNAPELGEVIKNMPGSVMATFVGGRPTYVSPSTL